MAGEIDKLVAAGLRVDRKDAVKILLAGIMHHIEDTDEALEAGKKDCARDLRDEALSLSSELMEKYEDAEIHDSFENYESLDSFAMELDRVMRMTI